MPCISPCPVFLQEASPCPHQPPPCFVCFQAVSPAASLPCLLAGTLTLPSPATPLLELEQGVLGSAAPGWELGGLATMEVQFLARMGTSGAEGAPACQMSLKTPTALSLASSPWVSWDTECALHTVQTRPELEHPLCTCCPCCMHSPAAHLKSTYLLTCSLNTKTAGASHCQISCASLS